MFIPSVDHAAAAKNLEKAYREVCNWHIQQQSAAAAPIDLALVHTHFELQLQNHLEKFNCDKLEILANAMHGLRAKTAKGTAVQNKFSEALNRIHTQFVKQWPTEKALEVKKAKPSQPAGGMEVDTIHHKDELAKQYQAAMKTFALMTVQRHSAVEDFSNRYTPSSTLYTFGSKFYIPPFKPSLPSAAYAPVAHKAHPKPAAVAATPKVVDPNHLATEPAVKDMDDAYGESDRFQNFAGCRSIATNSFLDSLEGVKNTALEVLGKTYKILTGCQTNFNEPLASVGCSSCREIILFDPQSEILNAYYQQLKKELDSKAGHSTLQIVNYIRVFVANTVFKGNDPYKKANCIGNTEALVADPKNAVKLLKSAMYGATAIQTPVIHLDTFLAKNTGVCRHLGLVTCYFIDRLIKQTDILKGFVHHIRDNIPQGAHVWALFYPAKSSEIYMVDSMWEETYEISQIAGYQEASKWYSEATVKRQLERTVGTQQARRGK